MNNNSAFMLIMTPAILLGIFNILVIIAKEVGKPKCLLDWMIKHKFLETR